MISNDDRNTKVAQALSITFITIIMVILFFKIVFF